MQMSRTTLRWESKHQWTGGQNISQQLCGGSRRECSTFWFMWQWDFSSPSVLCPSLLYCSGIYCYALNGSVFYYFPSSRASGMAQCATHIGELACGMLWSWTVHNLCSIQLCAMEPKSKISYLHITNRTQ